jgi:acyl-CoA synthetase (AMP-forming)/AMP-acid ligase II
MGTRISQLDVFARLFGQATNLREPRGKSGIVVAGNGIERAVTRYQVENITANAIEQLKEYGVKKGVNVVFYCENGLELSAALLACWALQATTTLVDYRTKRAEVSQLCKKMHTRLLLTSKSHEDLGPDAEWKSEMQLDVLHISQLAKFKDKMLSEQFDVESLDLDSPLLMLFTSGTTGSPKTSLHTLRSLAQNISDLAEAAGLEGGMTAVTPLPTSHIFGLSVLLVTQLVGMKTVLTTLDPIAFIKAVHRHKPDMIAALPQFYGALLSAPDGAIDLTDTKLLLCGGTPPTVSLADKFEAKFGKRLNNGYGSTESKIVSFNKDGPVLSVGKPVGHVQIDIVNERDELLPEGESGEVRIAASTMMNGYLNNEEENRKVLRSGHYYTGDFGRIENGYLFVAGRKNDIVIVGGAVVQAGEIEEALRQNSEVKEVAVIAVSNKRLGQIVKAFVVLTESEFASKLKSTNPDERLDAKRELQHRFKAYCKEHLSRYKRPMAWEFFGPHYDLPKTLAGKVDKKAMGS